MFHEQVCVQLPTPADNVTLLAFAAERRPRSNRSISPARRAHGSKPAAAVCDGRLIRQTDGQTDGRTPYRYADSPPRAMLAVAITHYELRPSVTRIMVLP